MGRTRWDELRGVPRTRTLPASRLPWPCRSLSGVKLVLSGMRCQSWERPWACCSACRRPPAPPLAPGLRLPPAGGQAADGADAGPQHALRPRTIGEAETARTSRAELALRWEGPRWRLPAARRRRSPGLGCSRRARAALLCMLSPQVKGICAYGCAVYDTNRMPEPTSPALLCTSHLPFSSLLGSASSAVAGVAPGSGRRPPRQPCFSAQPCSDRPDLAYLGTLRPANVPGVRPAIIAPSSARLRSSRAPRSLPSSS